MSFIIFLFRKRSIFAIKDRTFDSRTCIYRTFNLLVGKSHFRIDDKSNVRAKLISLSIYKFWCGHTVFFIYGYATTSTRKYMYRSHLFYIWLRRIHLKTNELWQQNNGLVLKKRQPSIRYLPDVLLLGVKARDYLFRSRRLSNA